MKVITLIMLFLAFFNCFTYAQKVTPTSNWVLEIKNENNTDELIKLKPGILTKIIFIVQHEDNKDFLDRSFDKSVFKISLDDDDDIILYQQEYNIIPSLALEYIAYIGLKCNHGITTSNYTLNFKVNQVIDLEGHSFDSANLKINPVETIIDNTVTSIDIEPIETDLTGKGYSLFRIKEEIYNMDKVIITAGNYDNGNYKFEDIELKGFKSRNLLGKNENENHGILFNFRYGTDHDYNQLKDKTYTTFNLAIKNDDDDDEKKQCFELTSKSRIVNITINNNQILKLNDSVKEAILYSIENVTPKRDITNNIQIKINIPVAPVIIQCQLDGEGDDDEESVEYNDYIINVGPYLIKFDNLNSNNEYKGECKFFSTSFEKTEFKISIGNEKGKDFITPLYPSRTLDSIPQCLEFTFISQNSEQLEKKIKKFSEMAEKLCYKTMTEDENIISRIMGNFVCEKEESSDNNDNKNKTTICIGSSPSYNNIFSKETIIDESKTYYDEHADKFIDLVNTTEKIKNIFEDEDDIDGLELIDIKRYYDLNAPDLTKIKLFVVNDSGMAKKDKLNFKIISSNEQPIECFYNQEMKSDDKKRFINLYQNKGNGKSITLYQNEEKTFETNLNDYKDKNMYTLYMNCYNLPGAKIRYEQTGIFNAYTYLYTDIEEDQSVVEEANVTINCAEKINKMNPHCLKGQYNYLLDILKTKIPDTDLNEEIEKFSKLSNSAKMDFLDELFKNFDEEMGIINANITEFILNIINKEKYLTNRDCSIYANGSSNNAIHEINNEEYKKCRENKKIKQKKIIELIKNKFSCDYLSILISKNGISANVEENIKYLILFIEELTNNADSFTEGDSEVLFNMVSCFQEKFDDYWNQVEEYLMEKGTLNISISAIKKDLSNLLINSIANLVKVLHFDEIDNYIPDNDKNITKTGIMANKKGKQIHKNIKQFTKYFNEFGDAVYNLSDSFIINVTINKDYEDGKTKNILQEDNNEIDEQTLNYIDKGILLILHPKSMMKQYNAYAMQVISYDSPLVPIKIDEKMNNNTFNTFISITLYDNKGNEINTDNISEDIRPKILYNKLYHKHLNYCYFYNEEKEDLEDTGVSREENYIYNGNKYLKCSAQHLTCFTAGNYFTQSSSTDSGSGTSNDNDNNKGLIALIILGSIFTLIIVIVLIIIIVKKVRKKNNFENIKKDISQMELLE